MSQAPEEALMEKEKRGLEHRRRSEVIVFGLIKRQYSERTHSVYNKVIFQYIQTACFLVKHMSTYPSHSTMNVSLELPTLLPFLSQKQKLVPLSTYPYDMSSLLISLNNSCIDSIKQEFNLNNNVLDLQKFLWLMNRAITKEQDEEELTQSKKMLLYYQLTRLFQDIDIDLSGTVEWKQFLEYLSASAWICGEKTVAPSSLSYDKQIIVHSFQQPSLYRKQPIKRVVQLSRNNSLLVLNRDLMLECVQYDIQQKKMTEKLTGIASEQQNESDKQKNKQNGVLQCVENNKVLGLDYSEQERVFGVLMGNRNLCFVEDGQMQKVLAVIRASGSEIDIKYLPIHKLWALQHTNSTLTLFSTPLASSLSPLLYFRPHDSPLTGICQLSSPLSICTSSLDGTIRLWQVSTGRIIIELMAKNQISLSEAEQKKGVKGIVSYNKGIISYICSWMFTSKLFIWLPSLSLSKPFSGQLRGHYGIVVDAVFTWNGELISLDDKRIVRIWNPDRLECLQATTLQHENASLIVLKAKPYLVAYSKLMNFYRLRTHGKPDIPSEIALSKKGQRNVLVRGQVPVPRLVGTYFSKYYIAVVGVTSQQAKIMELNTGKQIGNALTPQEDEEFVTMSSKRDRRILIGSSKGNVYEYKIEDGTLVKRLEVVRAEEEDLRFIYYHQMSRILLTIVERVKSSYVLTYDIEQQEEQPLKQIEFTQTDLIAFRFNPLQHKFYLLNSKELTIWNFQKMSIVDKINIQLYSTGIGYLYGMTLQEKSNSLIISGRKGNIMVQFNQYMSGCKITKLILPLTGEARFIAATIVNDTITKNLQEENEVKLRDTGQNSTKAKFKTIRTVKTKVNFNQDTEQLSQKKLTYTVSAFMLCLTTSHNETHLYDITDHLTPFDPSGQISKGKVQRIKQKRKSCVSQYMKVCLCEDLQLQSRHFGSKQTLVPNSRQNGSLKGYFYVFGENKDLHFFDINSAFKGQWNLGLSKPKKWMLHHNELNEIVARLQNTEKALKRIQKFIPGRLKKQVLIEKYLTSQDIEYLRKFQESYHSGLPSRSTFKSSNSVLSKKTSLYATAKSIQEEPSIKSICDLIKKEENRDRNNLFGKKLTINQTCKQNKNRSFFYQKIQESLKLRPLLAATASTPALVNLQALASQGEKPNNFSEQMQFLFSSKIKGVQADCPIERFSVNSKRKDVRKNGCNDGPRSSLIKDKSLSMNVKNRIRSSVEDLGKNFYQNKQLCHQFMNRNEKILAMAQASLPKRSKLQL